MWTLVAAGKLLHLTSVKLVASPVWMGTVLSWCWSAPFQMKCFLSDTFYTNEPLTRILKMFNLSRFKKLTII